MKQWFVRWEIFISDGCWARAMSIVGGCVKYQHFELAGSTKVVP